MKKKKNKKGERKSKTHTTGRRSMSYTGTGIRGDGPAEYAHSGKNHLYNRHL